ncbi:MAG: type II toxin-antitoxin system PemK/MazF family toxin [Acidobacteria bacterium]|nr:type II toxin-antitoxin system PemK/MazF family toxin [Acidobacteriota bacterium]
MLRGEIRLVDLEPALPGEARKIRPAVIVSNDAQNMRAVMSEFGTVTVAAVTSNVERVLPIHVLITAKETGLARDSKIQAEQIRAVSVKRVGKYLGRITSENTARLDAALRLHLEL